MASNVLPPEICRTIVRWADHRDWPTLARTSRNLQFEAEARLYRSIESYHNFHVYNIMRVIADCPRVAAHVRHFFLVDDRSRLRRRQGCTINAYETFENKEYWLVVRRALFNMTNLDMLCISDPLFENSWILEPTMSSNRQDPNSPVRRIPFQLREAKLTMLFTPSMAAFLEEQHELRSLCIYDLAQHIPRPPLSRAALLKLAVFEGPLILLDQLYHCPLTHLKIPLHGEDSISLLPLVLPELCRFKNLISLCIGMIPDDMALECADLITNACPNLLYLAYLPFPSEHVSRMTFLQCLTRLRYLRVLELDVTQWVPALVALFQRTFLSEVQMCIPSVRVICFWNGMDKWQWQWSVEQAQIPPIPPHLLSWVQTTPGDAEVEGGGDESAGKTGGATGAGTGNMNYNLEPDEDPGILAWRYQWGQNLWPMQSNAWRSV